MFRETWKLLTSFTGVAALIVAMSFQPALAKEKLRFALVQINQQALFFNQINEGAQRAADKAGVELLIYNANDKPSAQNDAIDAYIQDKVDAILVLPIDVNGIRPAIVSAKEAGIPVVTIDGIVEGVNDVQVGVDNLLAGKQIGEFMTQYINEKSLNNPSVGVVGALNSYIQNVRLDGFKNGLSKGKIVDTVDGRNVQDVAQTAAENLLIANPGMNLVYATGEPALIGALAATISQNAKDRMRVFGWDLTAQAVKGIDEGWVVGVIQQNTFGMGEAGVNAAVDLVKGNAVDKQIDVPVTIVTKANVDDFRFMFK
ncbi:putative ABC-type sugar transport system,periplasmic component [Vibrio nigripulchritudo SO65]|uniref:substrate-binding domain-containing protein n=1 Tax=Vibrio TaxID=662 RepID=UPI0002EF82BE|nr:MULTISPECIES: substrate-binding domain-containing protein [Vibrio]UAB73535.1 substrate-binding domain-containing protein [Vibrio sp. SCSIO 43132]CCN37810.1 putative ABC-type sugar transport system,periplasmic component [Vibrio nigripulchritudo AM115]CCN44766.1 putative ABC-type sugar transport system,periplasmic component [Vibrio nigripulchritudo FTn2]CCN62914.1 putative ABC-type sugar transport system,periplasmic component [Vibrio nigripulchritudo POn4]CCN77870.1 putative ABC-type sugar tr